jgi:hypothetical protein
VVGLKFPVDAVKARAEISGQGNTLPYRLYQAVLDAITDIGHLFSEVLRYWRRESCHVLELGKERQVGFSLSGRCPTRQTSTLLFPLFSLDSVSIEGKFAIAGLSSSRISCVGFCLPSRLTSDGTLIVPHSATMPVTRRSHRGGQPAPAPDDTPVPQVQQAAPAFAVQDDEDWDSDTMEIPQGPQDQFANAGHRSFEKFFDRAFEDRRTSKICEKQVAYKAQSVYTGYQAALWFNRLQKFREVGLQVE